MTQSETTPVATVARRWKVKRNASTFSGYRSYRCQAVVELVKVSTIWRGWPRLSTSTIWRWWLLLLAAILMLPGCTYSTNPIFVEQDNLFDEAFLGTWEADKDANFAFGKFEVERWGPEEKSYRAVLRNEAGEKQDPSIQLFLSQIDGKKFITAKFTKPDSEKASPDIAAAMYLTFVMDRCEGGELQMRYLLGDWLAGQVKKDPSVLQHEWIARPDNKEKRDLRLTAPTAELRAFVLEHHDKREAWMPVKFKKLR